jgi:two-component system, cell cycle response regulator
VDIKLTEQTIRVLVVAAEPENVSSLKMILQDGERGQFKLTFAGSLNTALSLLREHSPDQEKISLILLDLSLPDCLGLDTFLQVHSHTSDVPIVVLTADMNPDLALETIREGAQDCLFWTEMDGEKLRRAIFYAVERYRTWTLLQHLCFTDELTGLLNRRGFMSMANQHIKIARRENWKLLLLFADLDGLKRINDNYGHPQGDVALRVIADTLRETFRTSDLVARLGGDEFIVLAPNVSPEGVETIIGRLQENVERHNAGLSSYQLNLSWGVELFDPKQQPSFEDVIVSADQALYQHKRQKRSETIAS